jgi:hypothetical protein
MSTFTTRSKASVAGALVVMGKPDLGYKPSEMNAYFQIHVRGLDGGTYTLDLSLADDLDNWRAHQAGAGEDDTVIVDGPLVEAFRFTFAALGGAAAPICYVKGQRRV